MAREGLVLVEREITRAGTTFMRKQWVRPDEIQPGDKEVTDPAVIEKFVKEREKRKIYEQRFREKKKSGGTAKKPEDPPPEPPSPEKTGNTQLDDLKLTLEPVERGDFSVLPKYPPMGVPTPQQLEMLKHRGRMKEYEAGLDAVQAYSFVKKNERALSQLGQAMVDQFKGNEPGEEGAAISSAGFFGIGNAPGVNRVSVGDMPRKSWVAMYSGATKEVTLSLPVAAALRTAVTRGLVPPEIAPELAEKIPGSREARIARAAQIDAFRTLAHEYMHGVSNDHKYERNKNGPHTAMEEATTELMAQMTYSKLLKATGVLDPTPDKKPLLRVQQLPDGGVIFRLNKPTAYGNWVERFADMAAQAEGAKTVEEAEAAAMKWALTCKQTRGSMRYFRLADRLAEQAGADRSSKDFEKIRNEVAKHLQSRIRSRYQMDSVQKLVADVTEKRANKAERTRAQAKAWRDRKKLEREQEKKVEPLMILGEG